MEDFKILHFQDLSIENATLYTKPLPETELTYDDHTTVVIMRDPYEYFNSILEHYIQHEMSPSLSRETRQAISTMRDEEFLAWFSTLNYLPVINPQTFQLDLRKRIKTAEERLALFDYVVPYEKIDLFLTHIAPDIKIQKSPSSEPSFSLSALKGSELAETFIGKDLQLYAQAQTLWNLSESNQYKSLKLLIEKKEPKKKQKQQKLYRGVVGKISENTVRGWVFHMKQKESITVGIYRNGTLIKETKADKMRPDIQELMDHPTGKCGIHVVFETAMFKAGDTVEIKTVPDNAIIHLGKQAQAFLDVK